MSEPHTTLAWRRRVSLSLKTFGHLMAGVFPDSACGDGLRLGDRGFGMPQRDESTALGWFSVLQEFFCIWKKGIWPPGILVT